MWKVEHLSGLMTAAYWVDMMVARRAQHSSVMTADSKADYWTDSKADSLIEMTAARMVQMTAG